MIQQLKDASEDLVFLYFFTLPPMVSLSFKAGPLVGCTVASNISLVMRFFLCIQKETENDFSPMFSANILKFTLTGPGPVIGPITFCRWMDLSDGLSQGHAPGGGGRVSFFGSPAMEISTEEYRPEPWETPRLSLSCLPSSCVLFLCLLCLF